MLAPGDDKTFDLEISGLTDKSQINGLLNRSQFEAKGTKF